MSLLETLIRETRSDFIIAKSDGTLDAGEMIHIAMRLAVKLQQIRALSGAEKKALLMSTLRKGLQDAGGIQGVSEEAKNAVIDQVLMAASVSIDMAVSVAAGELDLRKPSSWARCIPVCVGYVLNGRDAAVLQSVTAAPQVA